MMKYRAFGLTIESELEIANLLISEGDGYDARLQVGSAPDKIENPRMEVEWGQWNDTECLIDIQETARYYVRDGRDIIVEPFPGVSIQTIALWLLGSVMAALLHQRGILPLHASAIAASNGAFLISGDSGAGKSSLAAAFLQQGFHLMADDVAALRCDANGQVVVSPAYPQQKLWQDTLDQLQIASQELEIIDYYKSKYLLPRYDHFWKTVLPVRALCIISDHDGALEINLLEGISKFLSIRQQIYRPYLMPHHGSSHEQLTTLMALGAQTHVVQIRRSKQDTPIASLVEICCSVIEDAASLCHS